MTRIATHAKIVQFHKDIAEAHNLIHDFYRFNWNEITGSFRSGVNTPALLLESYSSDFESQTKNVTNFNKKDISFLLLDFAGQQNDFDKQEEVLDRLENIALDIVSYLVKENKNQMSLLYGKLDINTVKIEKVGPIFDNMFGWNVLYNFKNHEDMTFDPTNWTFV